MASPFRIGVESKNFDHMRPKDFERNSLVKPLPLKEQAKKDFTYALVGWVRSKLRHSQCVRRCGQLVDFVVRQFKVAFHLVDRPRFVVVVRPRHSVALGAQLLKDVQHRLFGWVDEGALGDVRRGLKVFFSLGHSGGLSFFSFRGLSFFIRKEVP